MEQSLVLVLFLSISKMFDFAKLRAEMHSLTQELVESISRRSSKRLVQSRFEITILAALQVGFCSANEDLKNKFTQFMESIIRKMALNVLLDEVVN